MKLYYKPRFNKVETMKCLQMRAASAMAVLISPCIDWIPGMKNIWYRDLPSYARATDPHDFMLHFLGMEALNCFK